MIAAPVLEGLHALGAFGGFDLRARRALGTTAWSSTWSPAWLSSPGGLLLCFIVGVLLLTVTLHAEPRRHARPRGPGEIDARATVNACLIAHRRSIRCCARRGAFADAPAPLRPQSSDRPRREDRLLRRGRRLSAGAHARRSRPGPRLERRADAVRGRPAPVRDNGVRVSIGGPARGEGRRIRIVFGIAGRRRRTWRTGPAHQRHDPVRGRAARLRDAGRRQVHGGFADASSASKRSARTALSIASRRAASASGPPPACRAASGCCSPASTLQAASNSGTMTAMRPNLKRPDRPAPLRACALAAIAGPRQAARRLSPRPGPSKTWPTFPRGKLEISDGKKVKHVVRCLAGGQPAPPAAGPHVRARASRPARHAVRARKP